MDPVIVVAIVAAISAVITGLLSLRSTRTQEITKQLQQENAHELDAVKVKLEGWGELVHSLREDIEYKDKELEIQRGKNEALQETIDYLRKGLAE